MLRLRQTLADQRSFLDELPEDLAKLDRWLNDERFFEPFLGHYHRRLGRPSISAETYLRMMALKHQYGLSDRQLCASVLPYPVGPGGSPSQQSLQDPQASGRGR